MQNGYLKKKKKKCLGNNVISVTHIWADPFGLDLFWYFMCALQQIDAFFALKHKHIQKEWVWNIVKVLENVTFSHLFNMLI